MITKKYPPKFSVGDHVFNRLAGKKGAITQVINAGDWPDIRVQGYRYYVKMGRTVWSVSEVNLLLEKKSNDFRQKTETSSFNLTLEDQRRLGLISPEEEQFERFNDYWDAKLKGEQ